MAYHKDKFICKAYCFLLYKYHTYDVENCLYDTLGVFYCSETLFKNEIVNIFLVALWKNRCNKIKKMIGAFREEYYCRYYVVNSVR